MRLWLGATSWDTKNTAKATVDVPDVGNVRFEADQGFPLEYAALKMLSEAEKRQRERGIWLWLVGLTPEVLKVVQNSELGQTLGRERMLFNLEAAVANYEHIRSQGV